MLQARIASIVDLKAVLGCILPLIQKYKNIGEFEMRSKRSIAYSMKILVQSSNKIYNQ